MNPGEVKKWKVKEKEDSTRLDIFISGKLGISRKQTKKMIDDGLIRIGKRQIWMAGWKVCEGDNVVFGEEFKSSTFRLKVLYEDKDIIVVDKPAGMLSLPKDGSNRTHVLGEVKAYLKRKHSLVKGVFVMPLHRLDVETSGAMLFALSKVGMNLSTAFRSHSLKRKYLALVDGCPKGSGGTIDKPVIKGDFGEGRKVSLGHGGKSATTIYKVLERYKNASLLEVEVKTGRTHQVRVHLASIGCPIIGDKLYGGGGQHFKRQALHSHSITFKHPVNGKPTVVISPMPRDMEELVDAMRVGV